MVNMINKHSWTVLPYHTVRNLPHLKLAPVGIVLQRERCPCPIMDYSFTQVNQTSVLIAPFHSMQLGHTFQRVLQTVAYANPSYGPPYLMKLDLLDGYYRVPLTPHAALQLAVTLLPAPDGTPLDGIPLTLPMG